MLRVRSRVVGGWLLAGGLLSVAVGGACADNKGGIMLAVTTDMKAPKDVNAVAITIFKGAEVKYSLLGRVTPQGDILLPGTLAIAEPDEKNATIRIRVMAFQNQKPRVIRDVRTTVPTGGRTALLRIPLNFVNDALVDGDALPNGLLDPPNPGTEGLSPPSVPTPGQSDVFAGDLVSYLQTYRPKGCKDPDNETIIDGECKDSFIDSSTLPDFEPAQVGTSDPQSGSCFSPATCFAGAVGLGGMVDPGTPADAGSGSGDIDGGVPNTTPADAGTPPKPFKDFRPAAVTFDRNSCSLQLNGANPQRFNIAIVTPSDGECVRPGECYIPLDHGAAGWQEDDKGRIQLPSYLCKLLDAKGLRLVTSTDACAAKQALNPICAPNPGDDAGIAPVPIADAGKDGGPQTLAFSIPEDFATSVAFFGPTLLFASTSRQGFAEVTGPTMPAALQNINVAGSAHLPWRFSTPGLGSPQITLTNGSDKGYVLQGTTATPITVAPLTNSSAPTKDGFVWGVGGASSGGLYFSTGQQAATKLSEVFLSAEVTALLASPAPFSVLVGDAAGNVQLCPTTMGACSEPAALGQQVEGMIASIAGAGVVGGYALTKAGLFQVNVNTQFNTATSRLVAQTSTAGIDEGAFHFPHALANVNSCVFYSSSKGLEYVVDVNNVASAPKVLVPAAAGKPILGVAIGPSNAGGLAAYYTVFAPRDLVNPGGGGIHGVLLPPECAVGTPADAGTGTDGGAGGDAGGGPVCDQAACAAVGGCCFKGACMPGTSDVACGSGGVACVDCAAMGAQQCNVNTKTCFAP